MGVSVASVPGCVIVAMVEFGPVHMPVVMGVTRVVFMLVIVTLSVSVLVDMSCVLNMSLLVAMRDVVRAVVVICHVIYIYPEQNCQEEEKG